MPRDVKHLAIGLPADLWDLTSIRTFFDTKVESGLCARERGKSTDYDHWHVYVRMVDDVNPDKLGIELQSLHGGSVYCKAESKRGAYREYSVKEDCTLVDGPHPIKVMPMTVKDWFTVDLRPWQKEVLAHLLTKPSKADFDRRNRQIMVVGPGFATGKTTLLRHIAVNHDDDIEWLTADNADRMLDEVASIGERNGFIIDMVACSRGIRELMTAVEYIKNGLFKSNFGARRKKSVMIPPEVVLLTNLTLEQLSKSGIDMSRVLYKYLPTGGTEFGTPHKGGSSLVTIDPPKHTDSPFNVTS